jgi:nucleoside-diphosphate-sugar epimerase
MAVVVVTGGSGFIGSKLVRALALRGDVVRSLDRVVDPDVPPAVEFTRADIRDEAALAEVFRGADVVFHSVGLVPIAKDDRGFWAINVDGTRAVMRVASAASVKKVIHISSSAVYGAPSQNPVTEETPATPMDPYGRAKWAAEGEVARAVRAGLDVTIIRPRTTVGPGRLGIMQILFEWIRSGAPIPVLGPGDNVYQFVHVADLVDACLRAADRPGARAYNIGATRFGTMRETLTALIAHAKSTSCVVSLPLAPAEFVSRVASAIGASPLGPYHSLMYGRSLWFDTRRSETELRWAPRYSNVDAFAETYDWFVANRAALGRQTGSSLHRTAMNPGILRLASFLLRWAPP